MDQNRDFAIYRNLQRQLDEKVDLHKIKIIRTRMLQPSLFYSDYVYGTIGTEFFESRQFQKSISWLKRAIIVTPDDILPHIQLAKAFFELEKEDEAFFSIKKSAFFEP